MVHIIGGAKSAVNLFSILSKNKIDSVFYYFKGEYGENKKGGLFFSDSWRGLENISNNDKVIISSETAFYKLGNEDKGKLELHYFLRNKLNLSEICKEIKVNEVKSIIISDIHIDFPIIAKPSESGTGLVPFKFKVLKTQDDLEKVIPYAANCIFQPYLNNQMFSQFAIAGYFTGDINSLIIVKQLNQYPVGISSFVKQDENGLSNLKTNIATYLNEIGYRGFIEFEFKFNKKTQNVFLLDVNPRTWGWFYYYISAINNLEKVIFLNETPVLSLKKCWVNMPRLILSFLNGKFHNPSTMDYLQNKICYEPII